MAVVPNPDPPIPDASGLPPGTEAYAEYGERYVILSEISQVAAACDCLPASAWAGGTRYSVGVGPSGVVTQHSERCALFLALWPRWVQTRSVLRTNDYAGALAVFAAHRDRLAQEEP